jgi:RNA polymerase sigma factor (sigma-70 family)
VSKKTAVGPEGMMATAEVALSVGAAYVNAEKGLVEQCRLGDQQAFARLVALHEGMVLNLAARLLGDGDEARDAAQDVFLQVYRMLGRFEGRSSLKTWIYRIVVNHCRNRQRWWRRRRRDRSVTWEEVSPADAVELSSRSAAGTDPYEECRRREREGRVRAALARLSFDHRTVLLLREVEGLSCEEIAGTLGLPEGTVKSRLSRARESLRQCLLPSLGVGEPS